MFPASTSRSHPSGMLTSALVDRLSRHSPLVMRPRVPGRRTLAALSVGCTGPRLANFVRMVVSVTGRFLSLMSLNMSLNMSLYHVDHGYLMPPLSIPAT